MPGSPWSSAAPVTCPLPGERSAAPGAVLAPGRRDAVLLLWLWSLRRAVLPLLFAGLIVGALAGAVDEETDIRVDDPAWLLDAAFSPLVGVVVALALRLVVAAVSLAAAAPSSRWVIADRGAYRRHRFVRSWLDRWRVTRAYGALRWTWRVHDEAVERLGREARPFLVVESLMIVLTVTLPVAFAVTVAARSADS